MLVSLLVLPAKVYAQTFTSNVAINLDVADQQIQSGDILEQSSKGIVRSQTAYSSKIIGVAVENPTIVLHDQTNTTRSIIGNGPALVRVSNKTGTIKIGDFVTSSDTAGVGEKAVNPGYVIGIAQSNPTNVQNGVGEVAVDLNIHYAAITPTDLSTNPILRFFGNLTTSLDNPSNVAIFIRYMVGAFIALLAFIMGMYLFGRSIRTGLEAIGRNPLAKSSIQLSIILNLVLTAIVSIAGIIVAFIIIRF